MNQILDSIEKNTSKGLKQLAVLVDPDKCNERDFERTAELAREAEADYIFVGGSLMTRDTMGSSIRALKENSGLPCVIFPGNILQVSHEADAILLLTLISGRNPEMLIGNHVLSAPLLRSSGLEIIPTGYMLVESGKITSALYMSNTIPIPYDKTDIAICTAMAGEMLGLRLIFMDAGSGALHTIPMEMVRAVRQNIQVPLIVGGGIRTAEDALEIWDSGADLVVVGNAAESHPEILIDMGQAKQSLNE